MAPQPEDDSEVSFSRYNVIVVTRQHSVAAFRASHYSCGPCLQGNKPELSYEALQKALIAGKLQDMEMKRALQLVQAKIAECDALSKKGVRVLKKGIRRTKEARSSVRLLETQVAQVSSETAVPQLHTSIEEKQLDYMRTQEELDMYKSLFWQLQVCHS